MKKLITIRNSVLTFHLLVTVISCYPQQQRMKSFPLSAVHLSEGPFYQAQQCDMEYMLSLNVERLLVPFLREAGIPSKEKSYGNWENTGLDGHMGGHYLSALALMYTSTGNAELKRRLDYMIDQLSLCQKKNANGYVGGIPGGQQLWQQIKEGKIDADNFSLNKKWVPLYNIHKLYAGLRDAYQVGGNKKAREVFIRLCDWFVDLTASLSDTQIQVMLKSEHGGMNEVFADATEITGDQKYLVLAKKLSHAVILNPLLDNRDALTGLHANTQIPKVIGYKKIADMLRDTAWSRAAVFFWKTVVENRSVAIGGNSVREHFNPAEDFSSMIESNQGPETCNTYNMLRLTKALYLSEPAVKYLDYYERAVYNHILSSQHPVHGGFVYFTPMRPRHYRVYSSPQESFWCCVGSGLENHGKYGELIYAHTEKDIFVNLFIPSTLDWKEKGLVINQKTIFPFSETSTFTVNLKKPSMFTLNIRHPSWVKQGEFKIQVNGKEVQTNSLASMYVSLNRKWQNGDSVSVMMPMHTRVEFLPDGSSWGSLIHGPIVLAAVTDSTDITGLRANDSRMGHVAEGKFYPVDEAPVIVKNSENFIEAIKPVAGKLLTFSAESLIYPEKYKHIEIAPFFSIHDKRYIVYWQIASQQKLDTIKRNLRIKEKETLALVQRTIDEVVPGEQQPEVDHKFIGELTEVGSTNGKTWRNAQGWFSYDFKNSGKEGVIIRVTYSGQERNRKFDLLVNNKLLKTEELSSNQSGETIFIDYEIPSEILSGLTGEVLNVKFVAHSNSRTGKIFHVSLMK